MNKQRLLTLATFLRTIPKEKFNFSLFLDAADAAGITSCGSSGCAMGWACEIPEFKELGLRMNIPMAEPVLWYPGETRSDEKIILPAAFEPQRFCST